jgi:porin
VIVFSGDGVSADEKSSSEGAPSSEGILPIPDYSGDLWNRRYATGDWAGRRSFLAEKGVQLELDLTQTLQATVEGGVDRKTQYGGTADLLLSLDLYRLRLESRYGNSVNGYSGVLIPVNTDGFFPLNTPVDNDIPIAITDLTYYQFLSPKLGLFFGKLDTLDGDPNEFASGRGIRQFMNINFGYSPVPMLSIPYATLGFGVLVLPSERIIVTSTAFNTTDSSTSSGFDDLGEGWT